MTPERTRAPAPPARAAPASAPRADTAERQAPVARLAAAGPALRPGDVLRLQRALGNRAVGRLLAGTLQRQDRDDALAAPAEAAERAQAPEAEAPEREAAPGSGKEREEDRPAIAVGGGHHVTVRRVDGRLRLGVASSFTEARHIVEALLAGNSPLTAPQRATVEGIRDDVAAEEEEMDRLAGLQRKAKEKEMALRQNVMVDVDSGGFGPVRRKKNIHHPDYPKYLASIEAASEASDRFMAQEQRAVNRAKDAILALWEIGSDFLPTHLMPAAEVYRDKAVFGGNAAAYAYHAGTQADPIPITWYKAPANYPRLQLADGSIRNFGAAFPLGNHNFGLAAGNVPSVGWTVQKTAHNESRDGQKEYNALLNTKGVKVEKGGAFRQPPLGDTHQFDGDHVKDLGFGGADAANNYWPLDSTINRRAFTGYNSGYVVHYRDAGGTHRSRAIGGLVGKWFRVRAFLAAAAGPIPNEGAAAGGTPR